MRSEPLPPFMSVDAAIREALPTLNPPSRLSVSEVAPRRMIESGGQWVKWRADFAPYMTEPMDLITSRLFGAVVLVGPARSSKSVGLVENPLAHAILAQPRLCAVFSPTRDAAREWSIGTLDPLITHSPDLLERLKADNTFDKSFRGGARVTVDWPVRQKLAQRSIPLVLMTDYDAFPQDVKGDGSPFALGRKRTQSAMSRGMTVAESSPRFVILDETWSPETPHEAPPTEGILAIYNQGTRGRLYWTCRDCGGRFEPRWERMVFPDEGTPASRGKAAVMACLHCGSVIEPSHKREMNATAQWLHEGPEGELVSIGERVRETPIASFWLTGLAAAMAPWSQVVANVLEAEETFERTGDETAVKAVTNLELGLPYLPRTKAAAGLSAKFLRDAATDHPWKVAPKGTAFITVAVDVQAGRFVVQVEAWARDLARTVIDRFDIHEPPEGAPRAEDRRIDPARYAEDWAALTPLAERVWPVAAEEYGLRPVGVVIDAGGEAGVTPNAYRFWRKRRASHPRLFHLVRGRGGENVKRAEVRHPESSHQGKKKVARDVRIIFAGTDRLKDEVAASLLREAAGVRSLFLPAGAPSEVFEEYAAERRTEKGWEKRPGVRRNEALDLSVYALALVIVLDAERINFERPPAWARMDGENSFAIRLGEGGGDAPAPKRVRKGWVVKRPDGQR